MLLLSFTVDFFIEWQLWTIVLDKLSTNYSSLNCLTNVVRGCPAIRYCHVQVIFFFKNNAKLFFAGLEQSLYDVETTGLRRKQGDEHSSRNALGAWHRFVQQVSLALMTSWMSYCICASMNYGGKLWCCVGERVQQGNLVLPTRLKTGSGHRKGFLSPREGLTLGTLALQLLTWGGQFT